MSIDTHKFDITDPLQQEGVYKDIFEDFAEGKPSLSFPRFVVVGGPPGSGKSRIAKMAKKELAALGSPVMTDVDETRQYHPKAKDIFKEVPFKLAEITNEECWKWTSRLLLDARNAKNNVVYQATIRNAARIKDIIEDFQNAGFAADFYGTATNKKNSVYGIFNRFEDDIAKRSEERPVIPRWTPLSFLNQVYRVFPDNADVLSRNAGLERVRIFARDGREIYTSQGQPVHRGAKEAIVAEQERLWPQDERNAHNIAWRALMNKIRTRQKNMFRPNWYVRAANRYFIESGFLVQARNMFTHAIPSGLVAMYKTPHHEFVKARDGSLVGYESAKKRKTAKTNFAPI
ncbi:MAG: zeta toxin family protein [Bdellovibrionales bacterium]